jgi:hypothetical protein
MRITIVWGQCLHVGACDEGHILGLRPKARSERMRETLRRRLRRQGQPFACIWARDECSRRGLHDHMGLYWPLPVVDLVWLLADLTGSRPSSDPLPRGVLAQSECGGWQIKTNTARDAVQSAWRWTGYLLEQEPRHLVAPRIEGRLLGVSRDIDARAVEACRPELEAWKARMGWEAASCA